MLRRFQSYSRKHEKHSLMFSVTRLLVPRCVSQVCLSFSLFQLLTLLFTPNTPSPLISSLKITVANDLLLCVSLGQNVLLVTGTLYQQQLWVLCLQTDVKQRAKSRQSLKTGVKSSWWRMSEELKALQLQLNRTVTVLNLQAGPDDEGWVWDSVSQS